MRLTYFFNVVLLVNVVVAGATPSGWVALQYADMARNLRKKAQRASAHAGRTPTLAP